MESLYPFLAIAHHAPVIIIYTLLALAGYVQAQQNYTGKLEATCNSSAADYTYCGYYCNGPTRCPATIIYRSQPAYNTLSKISSLLNVHADLIAQANPNYNTHDVVESNTLVYVPITCSCDLGLIPYYFKRTTRTVGQFDTYHNLANNTYEGLSTCQAIRLLNSIDQNPSNFAPGKTITIPLGCACPTHDQQIKGITSLSTYVVGPGDNISFISSLLKVDAEIIQEANGLSNDSVLYPFTTLLIPDTVRQAATTSPSKGKIRAIIDFLGKNIIAVVIVAVLAVAAAAASVKLLCCSNNNCYWVVYCCWGRQGS